MRNVSIRAIISGLFALGTVYSTTSLANPTRGVEMGGG